MSPQAPTRSRRRFPPGGAPRRLLASPSQARLRERREAQARRAASASVDGGRPRDMTNRSMAQAGHVTAPPSGGSERSERGAHVLPFAAFSAALKSSLP